jgi:hypothetical protein
MLIARSEASEACASRSSLRRRRHTVATASLADLYGGGFTNPRPQFENPRPQFDIHQLDRC